MCKARGLWGLGWWSLPLPLPLPSGPREGEVPSLGSADPLRHTRPLVGLRGATCGHLGRSEPCHTSCAGARVLISTKEGAELTRRRSLSSRCRHYWGLVPTSNCSIIKRHAALEDPPGSCLSPSWVSPGCWGSDGRSPSSPTRLGGSLPASGTPSPSPFTVLRAPARRDYSVPWCGSQHPL